MEPCRLVKCFKVGLRIDLMTWHYIFGPLLPDLLVSVGDIGKPAPHFIVDGVDIQG